MKKGKGELSAALSGKSPPQPEKKRKQSKSSAVPPKSTHLSWREKRKT
jgi:hypothetical protein